MKRKPQRPRSVSGTHIGIKLGWRTSFNEAELHLSNCSLNDNMLNIYAGVEAV